MTYTEQDYERADYELDQRRDREYDEWAERELIKNLEAADRTDRTDRTVKAAFTLSQQSRARVAQDTSKQRNQQQQQK